MRHPLWIINSALLLLIVIALCIIFFTRQRLPRWASIEPTAYTKTIKKDVPETEIAKIYENDLFGTYQKPIEREKEKPLEAQLPPPPTPQAPARFEPPVPSFLDPLQVVLKGVIYVGNNERQNRIILENSKTKQELNLEIEDRIEDAQLIRIFKNRAIFIRSNGQEETVYLREKDALVSPQAQSADLWQSVIKRTGDESFSVDPDSFIEYVPSIGQLIEDLNLLTVYRSGKSAGLRIGTLDPSSFGPVLGLQAGDIITSINNIAVTDVEKRIEIYNKLTALTLGQKVKVIIQRGNRPMTITITLEDLEKQQVVTLGSTPITPAKPAPTFADVEEEKVELMNQKYIFAPTVDKIRTQEKQIMLKKVKHHEQAQQAHERSIKFDM